MHENRSLVAGGPVRLRHNMNDPHVVAERGNFDNIVRGFCTQSQDTSDGQIDADVHGFMFAARDTGRPGRDLIAIDIQRGRDHGVAPYNAYRPLAGLARAQRWEDFADTIGAPALGALRAAYAHWDDVDLMVGGAVERHVEGAQLGPVLNAIMTEQFRRSRAGDRLFYESGSDERTRFTLGGFWDRLRTIAIAF